MKDKILLTLGVASFFCVFDVRSVLGCVGQDKYKLDLYNYHQVHTIGGQSLRSIEQTVNPLSHQQLVALTIDDSKNFINGVSNQTGSTGLTPSEPQEEPQEELQEEEGRKQCRIEYRQCREDYKYDREGRRRCREDL